MVFLLLLYWACSNLTGRQNENQQDGGALVADEQRNTGNAIVGNERIRAERQNQARSNKRSRRGVTAEVKDTWKRYEWSNEKNEECTMSAHYGSTGDITIQSAIIVEEENNQEQQNESLSILLEEARMTEEPSCCICLCEYEPKDTVMQLPCNHIFHESCIDSWTKRNVRCPLCNCNLMEGGEGDLNRHCAGISEEQSNPI